MTILDEIQKWAEGIPDWQREAIGRLYAKGALDIVTDDDDLYAILKSTRGISDPLGRKPQPLDLAERDRRAADLPLVQLVGIKNLANVNALAADCALSFSPSGLTVVYGPNGSGKSGYARVLKRACRARDSREVILPNAALSRRPAEKARAELDILKGSDPFTTKWIDTEVSPTELWSISVFDASCAHAYVDNQGDFAYMPDGLDLLAKLGSACQRMKGRLQDELRVNIPNLTPLTQLARETQTAAGKLVASLSATTTHGEIDALAGLSTEETDRLSEVSRTLAVPEPRQQANALRQQAERFDLFTRRIREQLASLSDERATTLHSLIDASRTAVNAANLAAAGFKEKVGLLPGTWSDAWKELFEAARTFALQSVPVQSFPALTVGDPCPLCQQPADVPAIERFATFDRFIQGESEKRAREARAAAKDAFVSFRALDPNIGLDAALRKELLTHSESIVNACDVLSETLATRKTAIIAACAENGDWSQIPLLNTDPSCDIDAISVELRRQASNLDAASDDNARRILYAEKADLEARRLLGDLKTVAIDAVSKMALQASLNACLADIATDAISRKSTELTQTLATEALMAALNDELNALGVSRVRVAMKPQSGLGKASFKLVLELPGKMAARDVLSEGEQRAVAIASFFAEIGLSGTRGGVVFDDPVCSLDHCHREAVARRIAKESLKRQVIVFTHDLFFLNVLMDQARQMNIEPACRTLRRVPAGFGVASDELPFEGASAADRIGILKQMQVDCARFNKNGDEDRYKQGTRILYARLRETWERTVEEVLLQGVVMRFRKGVETNRLRRVTVEDADVQIVTENMGKCSTYTGHDGALEADVSIPEPEDVLADILALESWRKAVDLRSKNTRR